MSGRYPCYPLLPLVTLFTPCYPLLPLLPLVTPFYPLLPLLPRVTPCYPLLTFVTPCYPLLPFVTPCYCWYPLLPVFTLCYPLLPLLPFVTRFYPVLPLLPLVTLFPLVNKQNIVRIDWIFFCKVSLIQSSEEEALPPPALQSRINEILTASPNIAEAVSLLFKISFLWNKIEAKYC